MRKLRKPPASRAAGEAVEAYMSEGAIQVDPGNICLSCHSSPHSSFSSSINLGAGINTPLGNASVTVDNKGKINSSLSASSGPVGFVGGVNVTYDPTPGPTVIVNQPLGNPSLPSGGIKTFSAAPDNTRVGG